MKGKQSTISYGVFPAVSIEKARERWDTFRALLLDGIDLSENAKAKKTERRDEEARQTAATRFMLDNDGALFFRLGNRRLTLSPAETAELRTFLDATRAVTPKVTPCP